MNLPLRVKNIIKEFDDDAEVILFGSRAEGNATSISDWDFLILLDENLTSETKDKIRRKLYDLELNTNSVISSLIHSKEEWAKRKYTSIYKEIADKGILT